MDRAGAGGGMAGRGLVAVVLCVGIVSAALGFVFSDAALAHSPHDVIWDVELSPDFANDGKVFVISREQLYKSVDGGTTWRRLVRGLDNRRQLSSVEVSARNGRVLYLSSRGDGVFRSDDGGETWSKASSGLEDPWNKSILSLTLSPRSDDVVFAFGTGEGLLSVTTTGGKSWSTLDLGSPVSTASFIPDIDGVALVGDQDGGLHVSQDNGSTWTPVGFAAGDAGGITSIGVSPDYSSDGTYFVGTETGGVFVTTDGGETFSPAVSGLTDKRVVSLSVSQEFATDSTLWVSTWNEGVFESTDGGSSWTSVSEGLTTHEMAEQLGFPQFRVLEVSTPSGQGGERTMFVAGFDGLFRSVNLGRPVWQQIDTQEASIVAALAVSPEYANDSTVAVATYLNGALLSEDGGENWKPVNTGLASRFQWIARSDYISRVAGIGFFPSYGTDGSMFALRRGYFFTSTRGVEWEAQIPEGLLAPDEFPPDYPFVAFSPDFPSDHTIVLGTDRGKIFRSSDGGNEFTKVADIDKVITAFVVSPAFSSDGIVVAGTSEGVFRSTDRGDTWKEIGLGDEYVTSVAVGAEDGGPLTIYAGTRHGLFVLDGEAREWNQITDAPFSDRAYVEAVVLSPEFESDGTALVSVRGEGLFRSADGGKTFEVAGRKLFEDGYVFASYQLPTSEPIVFSPDYADDRTIYGFIEADIFRSNDGGDTWTHLDLPVITHDTSEDAAPGELLPTPRYEDPGLASTLRKEVETPAGRVSLRRLLAAVLAGILTGLVAFVALERSGFRGRSLRLRLAISAGGAVVATLAVLAVLAK